MTSDIVKTQDRTDAGLTDRCSGRKRKQAAPLRSLLWSACIIMCMAVLGGHGLANGSGPESADLALMPN
jgi:hypothetical protein